MSNRSVRPPFTALGLDVPAVLAGALAEAVAMTVLYAGPLPLVAATPVSVVIGGAVVGALSGNSFQILKETLVGTVLGLVAGVVGIAAFAAYSAVAVGVSPGTILAMAVTLGGGGALLVYPISYPLAVLAAKLADRGDPDLGSEPS